MYQGISNKDPSSWDANTQALNRLYQAPSELEPQSRSIPNDVFGSMKEGVKEAFSEFLDNNPEMLEKILWHGDK